MKKLVLSFVIFLIFLFILFLAILSTSGIETNKFNKLISANVSQAKNINLKLDTVKFKINLKELSLFLETNNPKISYKNISVPVKNLRVFINFLSVIKSDPKIEKINIVLNELDVTELNKLSFIIKPSNFKSILNNKIQKGKLFSEIDIYFNADGNIGNYIAKGIIQDLEAKLISDLVLMNSNFSFFADKNDILLKNIFGNLGNIEIKDGDLKINRENRITITSNFNTQFDFDNKIFDKYTKLLNNFEFAKNFERLKANVNNNLYIDLDSTYKIQNYKYQISGNLEKTQFNLNKPLKNNFINEKIEKIYFSNLNIKTIFNPSDIKLNVEGKYSLNNSDFFIIGFENNIKNELMNLKLDFDFNNSFSVDLINYKKDNNSTANLSLELEKIKSEINIKKLEFKDGNNLINLRNLELKKNKLVSFKQIKVLTENNDFSIQKNKKILIKGNKFDATQLSKFINNRSEENQFKNLNGDIEIDFKTIKIPLSEKLQDFKLIGEIKQGQFIKISSKGDFGNNNFLDISMKRDKINNKKYLEIFSDLTRPLLTDYSFFKGLTGGKLLFTSVIDETKSFSKLKIENFKVVNAPGLVKLLSLADLGGLADLAAGEGLTFDVLEIDMEKDKNFLKLNEILALGPSMSVLMEGYQDENNLTSLRGTLVPAKTLNKMISKIPVIGKIVIPKEVGEGLFGISFKMKGPKGNIKTTINPIKTLTPRFIQKIIEKNKTTK